MPSVADLLIRIRTDVGSALPGIKAIESQFKSFESVTRAALPASLALAAAGAGITLGFAGAVKSAADWQTTITNVRNNTNMSAQDTDTLRAAVLAMGKSSGAGFDQLAEGGKKAMNITGNMATSLEILDVAQKSAVSTSADVAQVTNVLANAMHEYGADVGTVAQIHQNAAVMMGQMHAAGQMSNMDLQEFAANSGRAIGVAANLGIPLQEVIAGYVGLTKHGFDAAGAQVQMVDIMTHMIAPTKQTTAELERLSAVSGVNLVNDFDAQTLSTKGLVGVMADITQAYRNTGKSQAEAEGETMKLMHALRGGLGLGTLLGTGAEDYAKALVTLSDTTAMATLTDEAYARTQGTFNNQMAVFSNQADDLGKKVGAVLLPPLGVLLGAVAALTGWFSNLPSPILAVLTIAGALAGGLLLVAGTLGILAAAAAPLAVGFAALGAVFTGVAISAAAAWIAVAWPVIAIIGIVSVAVAAWTQDWFNIREATASALSYIGDHIGLVISVLFPLMAVPGLIKEAWDRDFGGIRETFGAVVDFIGDKLGFLAGAVQNMKDGLASITGGAAQGIATVAAALPDPRVVLSGAGAAGSGKLVSPADAAKATATAAHDAAEGPLHKFTEEADQRKNEFERTQIDANTRLLQLKLDQAGADQAMLDGKRAIEDLDRNAVDFTLKRLQLDEQDAITRAKIAESGLKNNADDLTYQQQLLVAQVKAARARGEHVDMHAYRAQMKDLKKQEIEGAPALLIAEHNVSLADRAKNATDLNASLKTTDIERQKLALQEVMRPFEDAAIHAKRAVEDQQHVLDLAKQTFDLTEQQYALTKLVLEAEVKKTALDLYNIEHPVPASALPDSRTHAIDTAYGTTADRYGPSLVPDRNHPIDNTYRTGEPRVEPAPANLVQIDGGVHITVTGGDTSAETTQAIKASIGDWFQQAVDQVINHNKWPTMPRALGGTYGT